jgi:hypothetical protein
VGCAYAINSKQAVAFLRELIDDLRARLGHRVLLEFRISQAHGRRPLELWPQERAAFGPLTPGETHLVIAREYGDRLRRPDPTNLAFLPYGFATYRGRVPITRAQRRAIFEKSPRSTG